MPERKSSSSRSGSSRPGARKGNARGGSMGRRVLKTKACAVTAEKKGPIDYKDIDFISRYVTDRGKIQPRSLTRACAKKQRELARALRKARALGLLVKVHRYEQRYDRSERYDRSDRPDSREGR
jgi:small subunit ribosomal protein S18